MNPEATAPVAPYARVVALHSLGWLCAANGVGVWLGAVLLWPALGDALAPFTYGRWMPLHLNWQLYGWCALPLVGALLAWLLDSRRQVGPTTSWVLAAWTLALILGGAAWLGGNVSGKLFLDWHGWTRPLLPLAMAGLWWVLARSTGAQWLTLPRGERVARALALAVLLPVPGVFYWSTSAAVYPAVNPDSGGATGAALLGSTLGIISLYLALPHLLGLRPQRSGKGAVWALGASCLVFAGVERGHESHHSIAQVVALGTLLLWVPLLPWFWWRHTWPKDARTWLGAAAVWWGLLVVTGWLTFLPGISERLKFTHALVGHAHLAMAGLVTSVNAAILIVITGRSGGGRVFALWQIGCILYVGTMLALGWREAEHQAELFRSEAWTQVWLGGRWLGGLAMTAAAGKWLLTLIRA